MDATRPKVWARREGESCKSPDAFAGHRAGYAPLNFAEFHKYLILLKFIS